MYLKFSFKIDLFNSIGLTFTGSSGIINIPWGLQMQLQILNLRARGCGVKINLMISFRRKVWEKLE